MVIIYFREAEKEFGMIYSRMTETPVEILENCGLQLFGNVNLHLVKARFNYNDGGEPEERYAFAENFIASDGWDEIEAAIEVAEDVVLLENDLTFAILQAT